jgi:hypothetical protein
MLLKIQICVEPHDSLKQGLFESFSCNYWRSFISHDSCGLRLLFYKIDQKLIQTFKVVQGELFFNLYSVNFKKTRLVKLSKSLYF